MSEKTLPMTGGCLCGGTPLIFRPVGLDTIYISVGTLDHPEDAPPTKHTCIESKVPWLHIDDDLPRLSNEETKAAIARGE